MLANFDLKMFNFHVCPLMLCTVSLAPNHWPRILAHLPCAGFSGNQGERGDRPCVGPREVGRREYQQTEDK